MSYFTGLLLAIASLGAAIHVLRHSIQQFVDEVAIAVVLGGTIAVAIIIMPWGQWRNFFSQTFRIFVPDRFNLKAAIKERMHFSSAVSNGVAHQVALKGLGGKVLKDGQELMALGFKRNDLEDVLNQRIAYNLMQTQKIISSFRSLAKYPPAFGLMGTVFGLVELMRAITEGLEPAQTGTKMAIALVATLYGLIVANLIVAPIAEAILKRTREDEQVARLCLQAVLMSAEGQSLLKVQEIMNSNVSDKERIDFIGEQRASLE